jgi:hypothetical protein
MVACLIVSTYGRSRPLQIPVVFRQYNLTIAHVKQGCVANPANLDMPANICNTHREDLSSKTVPKEVGPGMLEDLERRPEDSTLSSKAPSLVTTE